jgi:Flp pilus assembly protein TadD
MDFDLDTALERAARHIADGRSDLAVLTLHMAVPESAHLGATLKALACLYARLQLPVLALGWYECCFAFLPHTPDLWLGMARLQLDCGNCDAALLIWNDLLEKHPLLEAALFYSAWALRNRQPEDAVGRIRLLLHTAAPDSLYAQGARQLLRSLGRARRRICADGGNGADGIVGREGI